MKGELFMFDHIKIKQENHHMQTKTHAVNPSMSLKQESSPSTFKQDMAELSKDWQKRTDWSARARDTLEQLQQSFPQINIMVSESLDAGALHTTAASLGSGIHLILTEEFLAEMGQNQEQYARYKEILIRALTELSKENDNYDGSGIYLTKGRKVIWHGTYEKNLVPEHKNPDSFLVPPETNYEIFRRKAPVSYKTGGSYTRLAGASSKTQVYSVLSDVHQNIASLRITSIYGDERDRTKAKTAIASLNKLLLRGQQKLRRLDTEQITKLRQKRAEQKQEQEKALRIKIELAKKRTERRTSDGALIQEGRLGDLGRDYYHKKYKAYEYDLPSGFTPAPITPVIPASGLLPSDITQAFTPSEVTISEGSSF